MSAATSTVVGFPLTLKLTFMALPRFLWLRSPPTCHLPPAYFFLTYRCSRFGPTSAP